jgi:hypothetical protein
MVALKFELEDGLGEMAAEAAVEKTVRFYRRALEGVTCPVHGSYPSLLVKGGTMARLAISIEVCCAALSNAADDRVRAVSRREDDL